MPFKKGQPKTGGRKKKVPNHTTKQAKELLEQLMFGRISSINTALDALEDDPSKYLDAVSKLFAYVLPKKTDITSKGDSINKIKISFKHD